MATMMLPIVSTCTVEGCSYNHDHDCHAGSITVTSGEASMCGTYVPGDGKAGVMTTATVGACHRADCVHNSALECTAKQITVGMSGDPADCLTYAKA